MTTATAAAMILASASVNGDAAAAATNLSFYGPSVTPTVTTVYDHAAVDLGLKFTSSAAGTVSAIRFFKGSRNVGTHTGYLWSSSGAQLASVQFKAESASGWQVANLSKPVAVAAGRTYTAAYRTAGYYSDQENTFASGKTLNVGPLRAVAGTYHYGSTAAMPTLAWHSSSYYVDVVFQQGTVASTPPKSSAAPAPTTKAPTPAATTKAPTATPTTKAPTATYTTPAPAPTTTAPASTGYPDASNTGPRVTALTTVTSTSRGTGWAVSNGTLTISGANVTLQRMNIPFEIDVKAANAKILDNVISNTGMGWAIGLYKGNSNTVISYNIIQGPDNSTLHNGGYQNGSNSQLEYGIFDATGTYGGVATTEFNEFRYLNHPLNLTSGTIRNNYMHNFSNTADGSQHTDAIFSGGGDTKLMTISHNTMINDRKDASAAVVLLSNAFGAQTNVVINDNVMAGGGFVIYGGGGGNGWPIGTHITITNNKICTHVYAKGGYYGPFNVMPQNGVNGNVVSGNIWYDGPNAGKAAA